MNADEKEKGWYGGCEDALFLKKATGKCYWRPGELMGGWQERRRHGEISMKQMYVFCSKIIPGASLLLALVSISECWSHTKYFVSWSHRRQLTRLPHPWDSPGKNTGVGCHFLLQCMKVKSESEVTQSCPTPSNPMDCSLPASSVHGIFQTRVLEWYHCLLLACIKITWWFPKTQFAGL